MSEITLIIDGKTVAAQNGMTILDAARGAGIDIPTLCHYEKLVPYTGCRICVVEVEVHGRTQVDTACSRRVTANQVIKTRSELIDKTRKILLEMMLAHAPDSLEITRLAKEYKAQADTFEKGASFCILCGLCVRYCAEVKKLDGVNFVDRGPDREIAFDPEVATKECWNCKECFPLCPTVALQRAYLITEALVSERTARRNA